MKKEQNIFFNAKPEIREVFELVITRVASSAVPS